MCQGLSFIFCSVLARVWRVFRLVGGSKDLRTLRKIPEAALWGVTIALLSMLIVVVVVVVVVVVGRVFRLFAFSVLISQASLSSF
jgi:hypothetical protein